MKPTKNKTLSEFEGFIRSRAQAFYRAAYAVKGERVGAERLTEEAMLLGAKRYGDLMNKERVADIILERIGEGTADGFEPTDLSALCDRVMSCAYAWRARRTVFLRILTGVLALAVCVGIALPLLPDMTAPASKEVLQMKNASVIKGESGNVELLNYQQISKACTFNQENFEPIIQLAGSDRVFAAVTAPDGTPYAVFHNLETLDGSNTTFTLYRGYEKGWEAVGTAEIGAVRETIPGTDATIFKCSEIYVYADKDSDVYVLFRVDAEVRIWRYDAETGAFEQKQTVPFTEIDTYHTLEARFDLEAGEKGALYFSCNFNGKVKIYRYDTASDSLSLMTENVQMQKNDNFIFCVKDGTVYGVTEMSADIIFYRILPDGTVDERALPVASEKFFAIEIDGESNVHMLGYRNSKFKHYIVKPDMSFSVAPTKMLCYEGTDYRRNLLGAYIGEDGKFYYLEYYVESETSEACLVAIGRADGDDPAKTELADSLYLLDNVLMSRFFRNGKEIAIIAMESFSYDDPYIVYFHVGEIVKEK